MITFIEYNNVGIITDEAAVTVNITGVYTVTAGKKGVSLQNIGDKIVWYGGSTVDTASRGNMLFPRQTLVYKNVKKTFKIYFKAAIANPSTIGVVTHD